MDTKEFEILHWTSVFYNVLTSMTECFLDYLCFIIKLAYLR